MTLQDDMDKLKMIARAAAEEQSNATRSANMVVISEMMRVLQDKGIISSTDITSFCTRLEKTAASMQIATPAIASALTETTLIMRHIFSLNSTIKQ